MWLIVKRWVLQSGKIRRYPSPMDADTSRLKKRKEDCLLGTCGGMHFVYISSMRSYNSHPYPEFISICSYSFNETALLICSQITGVEELPVKPSELALVYFSIATCSSQL